MKPAEEFVKCTEPSWFERLLRFLFCKVEYPHGHRPGYGNPHCHLCMEEVKACPEDHWQLHDDFWSDYEVCRKCGWFVWDNPELDWR